MEGYDDEDGYCVPSKMGKVGADVVGTKVCFIDVGGAVDIAGDVRLG